MVHEASIYILHVYIQINILLRVKTGQATSMPGNPRSSPQIQQEAVRDHSYVPSSKGLLSSHQVWPRSPSQRKGWLENITLNRLIALPSLDFALARSTFLVWWVDKIVNNSNYTILPEDVMVLAPPFLWRLYEHHPTLLEQILLKTKANITRY